MKPNIEILGEAKLLLIAKRWFWRIVLAYLAFNLISVLLGNIPNLVFGDALIPANLKEANTPEEILSILKQKKFLANLAIIGSFTVFLSFLARAISNTGISKILLKGARNYDGTDWFKGAFCALKDPFGALLLFVVWFFRVLWIPIFIIMPAMIFFSVDFMKNDEPNFLFFLTLPLALLSLKPFYRFRQIWFIKSERPELGALEIMKESDSLMEGNKMKNFHLDCRYWKIFTLILLLMLILTAITLVEEHMGQSPILALVHLASMGLVFYLAIYFNAYWDLGQAIFYREISDEKKPLAAAQSEEI
ncbi:MAG: hypothetical protein IJQ34_02935 [Kiritimatiellae bacterium]|nr:hypothetical protein [Kiritimatiellia bacterium]